MLKPLRFRQVHLDFHTSGSIAGIAEKFDKHTYQETLKRAAVNSITTFATCHHGWSYYDTKVGKRHPGLSFDLLRAQFDACKEIDINVPIYLTAGVHDLAAKENPQWRTIDANGQLSGWSKSPLSPGFKMLSFHSPYLDYLCEQLREVVTLFPDADGIFLDIISQREDCSEWGIRHMLANGLDPLSEADRMQSRRDALMKYYKRSVGTIRELAPDMPIFHNSGHIPPGCREILPFFSHLEAESLPTGGWGYDHFPLTAKYIQKLDIDYLGMTGKFHSTWGEFGGFKHPNALLYECSAMLAYGAKCSIGDQLHPSGVLDLSTYEMIGKAYREVEQKEHYIQGARNVADIGVLSSASLTGEQYLLNPQREDDSDTGATRVLLEEHLLFDVIDTQMDFNQYRVLVLPDRITLSAELEDKLHRYLQAGGKLFLTGDSGINSEGRMSFDTGSRVGGLSEFSPDFILPCEQLRADFVDSPMVMYGKSRRVSVTDGESLGEVYDPYFNRTWNHFCSHQHAPARTTASGYACGSRKNNICYLAHPVFDIYRKFGQVALRQYISKALKSFLAEGSRLQVSGLPSTARVTLTHQPEHRRYVLHLLNAQTISRGGKSDLQGGNIQGLQGHYEVIEELTSIHNIGITLQLEKKITKVSAEPQGESIDFDQNNGNLRFGIPELGYHKMLVLKY